MPTQNGSVVFVGSGGITFASPTLQQAGFVRFVSGSSVRFDSNNTTNFEPWPFPVPHYDGSREPYRLIITDIDQSFVEEFDISGDPTEGVRINSMSWVLNGIGALSFTVSTRNMQQALIGPLPAVEAHVWRGNRALWSGPVTGRQASKSTTTYDAKSLEWYYTKRVVGEANRFNFVQNPGFENGIDGWDVTTGTPTAPPAQAGGPDNVTIMPSPVHSGTKCARLEMTVDEPFLNVGQTFLVTASPLNPEGNLFTLAAWFYIVDWDGPSGALGRGMSLNRYSTTETVDVFNPVLGQTIAYPKGLGGADVFLDADTPRNTWVRAEVSMEQPIRAGQPEFITVGLWGIKGVIRWDDVSLTIDEALEYDNQDQAAIVGNILFHAEDSTYGKSNLRINQSTGLTGVLRDRKYFFSDHQVIWDILSEFPTLHNGLDIGIKIAPNGSDAQQIDRTFHTFFPYRGYRRNDIVLELGVNILDFTLGEDGEGVANSVIVMSEGEGSDREEGGYVDTDALNGLVLERAYNATPGSHIQTLNDQAKRGVDRFKKTLKMPTLTTMPGTGIDLIDQLEVGDVVQVIIDYFAVQINDWYRVISITLDPNTDQLSLVVNPLSEEQVAL